VIVLTLYVVCFTVVLIFSESQHIVEKLRNTSVRQGKDSYSEIIVIFNLA